MSDDAVLRHQFRYGHAPLRGCGQQKPFAGFGARLLQVVAALPHIPARVDDHAAIHAVHAAKLHRRGAAGIGFPAAGYLQCPLRRLLFHVTVGRRVLGPDLLPITLELLGHHHRVHGERAGSEFRLADADGHRVVGRDRNPGVDLGNHRFAVPGLGGDGHTRRLRARRQPEAEDHRASDRSGGGEELPAIHFCCALRGYLALWLFCLLLTHGVLF